MEKAPATREDTAMATTDDKIMICWRDFILVENDGGAARWMDRKDVD
jgi:hypothetical protein